MRGYDERRAEILDSAQKLFFLKGYETASVNEIIEAAGISKGTFYHYFESKDELLESIAERLVRGVLTKVREAIAVEDMDAVTKLNIFIEVAIREKVTTNRELVMMFLRTMMNDENVRLREKIAKVGVESCKRDLSAIISQGVAEGAFTTGYADEAAEMILGISAHTREAVARLILGLPRRRENWRLLKRRLGLFIEVVERILGARKGSVSPIDMEMYEQFIGAGELDDAALGGVGGR